MEHKNKQKVNYLLGYLIVIFSQVLVRGLIHNFRDALYKCLEQTTDQLLCIENSFSKHQINNSRQ